MDTLKYATSVLDTTHLLYDSLVRDKPTLYSYDRISLACLASLFLWDAVKITPIDLPDTASDRAMVLAKRLRQAYDCYDERVIEWGLRINKKIKIEMPIKQYGKADAAIEEQKIIIECGDTRTDKPMAAMLLGYKLVVCPFQFVGHSTKELLGRDCKAIMFEACADHEKWKYVQQHYSKMMKRVNDRMSIHAAIDAVGDTCVDILRCKIEPKPPSATPT